MLKLRLLAAVWLCCCLLPCTSFAMQSEGVAKSEGVAAEPGDAEALATVDSDESAKPQQALKESARGRFLIGVGVPAAITTREADWPLLTTHFEMVTPENCMKPQSTQPTEGDFRFDACDEFVSFSIDHRLKIVGHCLVWAKDDRTPEWFATKNGAPVDRDTLLARMKTHIEQVAGRYGDKIAMWDVVNEALSDGDGDYLRDSVWSRTCDEEFIVKAFEYARAAAPKAMLIYNDYRCDMPEKREKLIRLVRSLKEHNAPIDAVGLQGHYELDSIPFEGLEAMFAAMRELEVKVVVSELDIDVVTRGKWWAENNKYREELKSYDPYKDGCPPEILERQAQQFAQLFALFCKYDDVIERVSFWNLHDGQSWLNYFPWNRTNYPLLFDRSGNPKPAFAAVTEVLKQSASNRLLAIHGASYEAVDGWEKRNFQDTVLWIDPEPLLTHGDVVSAQVNDLEHGECNHGKGLAVELTEVAGKKLFAYTKEHLMQPMAIMMKNRIVSAPKVVSPIGQKAQIVGRFSDEELQELLETFNN